MNNYNDALRAEAPSKLYERVLPEDAIPDRDIEATLKMKGRYSMKAGEVPKLEVAVELEMPIPQCAEMMGLSALDLLLMFYRADDASNGEYAMVFRCPSVKAVVYGGGHELEVDSKDATGPHRFAIKSGRIEPQVNDTGWPVLNVALSLAGAVESREVFDDRLDDDGIIKAKLDVIRHEPQPSLLG